jgi:hypothetical protein
MSATSVPEIAAQTMLTRLDHLVRSSRVHPDDHAALAHASHAIGEELKRMLDGKDVVEVCIVDDRILLGDRLFRALPGIRSAVRELGIFWQRRGLGGLQIGRHTTEDQFQPLVRMLLDFPGDGGPGPEPINRALSTQGIRHLRVVAPPSDADIPEVEQSGDPALTALRLYMRGLRFVHALYSSPITPSLRIEARNLAWELVELYLSSPRRALALVRPKELVEDHLTHPVHVAVYATAAGQLLGLDRPALEELAQCALALAPGLQPEEDEEADPRGRPPRLGDMATSNRPMDVEEGLHHARAVQHLIADGDLTPLARRLVRTVFEHNMGLDGAGPPNTLRWVEPHPYTKLLCAAAEFDHLRGGHATGRAYAPDQAIQQMKLEIDRYDAHVLNAFEGLLPELEIIGAYV